MKIAVTGATGKLGKLIVENLKKEVSSDDIIALVRTPEKATELGVETRKFDYNQPDAGALQGVDKLLLISGNEMGQRSRQHGNVIAAAKSAGIKHLVYTSLLKSDTSTLSLASEHLETEGLLKSSGLQYTILRNGWYTENYTGSVKGAVASGVFAGSAGDGKISSAPRSDYAEAAAVVLTSDGHENKTYELSGDEYFTLSDLAAEISRQTGKTIPYNNLSAEAYTNLLISFNIPESYASAIAGWDIGASKNDLYSESKDLSKLIGHPTTPLSVVLADALKA